MGAMATFAGYDKLASHVDRRLGNVPVAGSSPGAPKMTVAFAAIHQSLRYRGEDTRACRQLAVSTFGRCPRAVWLGW
jgi:hypothetical protein